MTDDLIAFLRARLDETERIARAAYVGSWHVMVDERGEGVMTAHIAANDPARVLRQVEAHRAILDMWEDPERVRHLPDGVSEGRDQDEIEAQVQAAHAIDEVVGHLASIYSDHSDFREEWR